jgi:thiamine-monophosphate kinase
MKLRQVGEDRLLQQLFPALPVGKGVVAPAGDDCALVEFPRKGGLLVLKTDCVVEKIHFQPGADPVSIGWKAMMRPLSDFAAVSGLPQFALITLIVSAKRTNNWVKKIYCGLSRAAARFDVSIVGGETSSTRGPAAVSVSVVGFVEKDRWVSRAGGKAGDDLFVTGRLGRSIRGKHLQFVPRIEESRWLTKNFPVHAMIDLSDGLGADLPRLAAASKVGFEIDKSALPRNPGANIDNAITDGEDYELLFAISPRQRERLEKNWRKKFPGVPLARIGRFHQPSTIAHQPFLPSGYVHFQ